MGSKTASQFFQKQLAELIFEHVPPENYVNYVDDSVVFANTFEDLLKWTKIVFQNNRKQNFKLNLAKCTFGTNKIKIFGFFCGEFGIAESANSET